MSEIRRTGSEDQCGLEPWDDGPRECYFCGHLTNSGEYSKGRVICGPCLTESEEAAYYDDIDRRIDERQDPTWDDERTGR